MTRCRSLFRRTLAWLSGAIAATACAPPPDPIGAESLESIRARGELVVLTLESPTTFHRDEDGDPDGYEVALVTDFARSLGVGVRFEPQVDLHAEE